MRKIFLASLALALGLVALPAGAVTFGSPDGNDHPHVGTLLFRASDGFLYSCTGTMMNSTVMLTAGHCTETAGVANPKNWVKFDPVITINTGCGVLPPADRPACVDAWLDDPANGWIKGTATAHPDYDDYALFPATFDIGVVELDTPVTKPVYGALPPLGFLATIRKAKDDQFTVVGYGMQGYVPAFLSDVWARYAGTLKLVETKSLLTGGGMSAKFTNNAGVGGGTCYGDSGGPIFYGNTNIVVAVVSFGYATPCIGTDFNFRTDIPLAQDFLADYL